MNNQEIIAIPRIADLLVSANFAVQTKRIVDAKVIAGTALDVIHTVWGTAPWSAIGQVQVWALQALWVSINNAE